MALCPGRQRTSAPPIIAKGLVYPLQNYRASKLYTHVFASFSYTHHNTARIPFGIRVFLIVGRDGLECKQAKTPRRGVFAQRFTEIRSGARQACPDAVARLYFRKIAVLTMWRLRRLYEREPCRAVRARIES